jgi:hypothetical protein
MTKQRAMAIAGLATALLTTTSAAAEPATGAARLHPIDRSGVRARIVFLDTGSPDQGLVVSGQAAGLDPAQTYVSLIYDTGAVPGGPRACEPTGPTLSPAQMIVGTWQVAADGTGTLFAVKTAAGYAALESFDAVSVRIVVGPPPAGFVLQACGQVHRNP